MPYVSFPHRLHCMKWKKTGICSVEGSFVAFDNRWRDVFVRWNSNLKFSFLYYMIKFFRSFLFGDFYFVDIFFSMNSLRVLV